MLRRLQKDHAQCCADDGEDCPEDSEDTCRRLKPLMPKKVLLMDKDRITTYEQCCKDSDDGEWCPDDSDDSDCESMLRRLQKDHAQCCADDGEDCPEDSEVSCRRLKPLMPKKVLLMDKDRITTYEQCCADDGKIVLKILMIQIANQCLVYYRKIMLNVVQMMGKIVLKILPRLWPTLTSRPTLKTPHSKQDT